ncbi:MAG: S-layer homology domain-containing protein, partial [Tissierellia bacterium]|nr:S-layer homology domain-containing protein [Tissierellia bacterium]
MKNIIKKLAAFGLCAVLTINMNVVAYANILDDIIDDTTIIDNTEDVDNTENPDSSEDVNNTESNETNVDDNNVKAEAIVFSDIDDHWAKDWIKDAVNLGFVSGYEGGTFKPDNTITRAEFSTMLNKAMQIDISEKLNFSDVRESDWFYKEIQKSVAAGFFSGYENNTFRPNNPIKREEVSKVVA